MVVALAAGILITGRTVSAGETVRRAVATVRYLAYSDDGCVRTNAYVHGVLRTEMVGHGAPLQNIYYWVFIEDNDYCTGERFRGLGSGILDPDIFDVNGMSGASFTGTVQVFDWYTRQDYDVEIDLSWEVYGKVTRTSREVPPSYTIRTLSRESDIVGSVMLNGYDYVTDQYYWTSFYVEQY